MKQAIADAEQSIKKAEKGHYEEFYDLNLIEKGTQATDTFVDGDALVILDQENGKVHIVSLEKKSVRTITSKAAKAASLIAIHQDEPYLFSKDKGVTKLGNDKKETIVVPADKDWGSVKDFHMYSGNIYLLATTKDEIYKYLIAENGYSDKSSYFKSGNSLDLANGKKIAIDSSLYLIDGKKIYKYTSGLKQPFTLSLPDSDIDFENIFTSKDIDNVYLLDKDSGRIFIIDKEGKFIKQISANIISTSNDFFVTQGNQILVLSGDKIYNIIE
jgi:hypothetical protein